MYAVVEFVRGERETIKECALVPVLWLTANNTLCYWPRTKTDQKFKSLVKANAAHEQSWPTYAIYRVLHTAVDYDSAVAYMANAVENGTSEDGITFQPIVQREIVMDDDIPDRGDQTPQREAPKKRTKKGRKRDKRHKKNKRSKYAESSNSGNSEASSRIVSSNEENESPNVSRYERSLTGLDQNLSIMAEGRDISINTEMYGNPQPTTSASTMSVTTPRTNVDSTPKRSIIHRNDLVQTPHSKNSTPQRSAIDENYAVQTPRSSIVHSTPGASGLTYEENTLRYLGKINAAVDQNQIILGQILRINEALSQVEGSTRPQGFPDFPIASSEIFDEFNEMLENEAHRTYLIKKLASVGGLSQRQAVMNMLKFVMSNSLAMMYNWAGREKKCFKKTKFMTILNEAAKVAFRGKPESSDVNIAAAVKDWLKLATSRHMYAITGKKTTPK